MSEMSKTLDPITASIGRMQPTRYNGQCGLNAGHRYFRRDVIGLTQYGWICPACVGVVVNAHYKNHEAGHPAAVDVCRYCPAPK